MNTTGVNYVNSLSDSSQWDAFHDVLADVMTCKNINDKTLLNPQSLVKIYNRLPENIKSIAREWGMGDTVFRDAAHVWLSANWLDI